MNNELKNFVTCPACESGQIIHAGDHYYCNSDNRICNFMIRSDQYGARITKAMMVSLVRKRFLEPMFIDLQVFPKGKAVNGFIIISKSNKVGFVYPKNLPIAKCPKCKENDIIMKYNREKESFYYGCTDYKKCGFTLPYIYREKPLRLKDIRKLCSFNRVAKEYLSKNQKRYTIDLFLDKDLKMSTSF